MCANAGDSRAIVVRKDGSVVRLSRDHKPGMPDETKRITDLGVSDLCFNIFVGICIVTCNRLMF